MFYLDEAVIRVQSVEHRLLVSEVVSANLSHDISKWLPVELTAPDLEGRWSGFEHDTSVRQPGISGIEDSNITGVRLGLVRSVWLII